MLSDDQNSNRVTGADPNRRGEMGSGTIALIAAAFAVVAILIMWAPWNGPKLANAPGSTVGSSTTSAPMAPNTAPAPPTAPPTTR